MREAQSDIAYERARMLKLSFPVSGSALPKRALHPILTGGSE